MEPQELADWLEKGLGRAVLALRDGHNTPLRDTIVHACRHDQRVDGRCEDGRGMYLYDIIQATGEPDYYRDIVLAALADPADDDDQDQLFEIARFFAQAGDTGARSAMYTAFERNALKGDLSGSDELVLMDGIDALPYVSTRLDGTTEPDNDWMSGSWILRLEERDGEEAAWEALDMAASTDPRVGVLIERYRRRQRARKEASDRRPRPTGIPYAEMRSLIQRGDPKLSRFDLSRWGERAPAEDIRAAAADLIAEEQHDRLVSLIRVFHRRGFPLDPAKLLALSESDDERVQSESMYALTQVQHPEVRARGITLLSHPRFAPEAVGMLLPNFNDGDELMVEDALQATHFESDVRHRVGVWARDFVDLHPDLSDRILNVLYETTPCSTCRESAVDMMVEADRLPDRLREECRWDASAETRRLAAKGD